MDITYRIRKAVREKRYVITYHAYREAFEDNLTEQDILDILRIGELIETYTDDPRGDRYKLGGIIGEAEVDVICRFDEDGRLVIVITVWAL